MMITNSKNPLKTDFSWALPLKLNIHQLLHYQTFFKVLFALWIKIGRFTETKPNSYEYNRKMPNL